MRVQFCSYYGDDVLAEFEVVKKPTQAQCDFIEDYIFDAKEKWEEENDDDLRDFDYWEVCLEALCKCDLIVENPVIKTFYV